MFSVENFKVINSSRDFKPKHVYMFREPTIVKELTDDILEAAGESLAVVNRQSMHSCGGFFPC